MNDINPKPLMDDINPKPLFDDINLETPNWRY